MKYLIIGGSRGLGLAIAMALSVTNDIIIYDINEPLMALDNTIYKKIDLANDDISIMKNDIKEADGLIYTAGIGRIDYFNNQSFKDIDFTITINLISVIKVLTLASDKLLSKRRFDCLCISSIAGLVSSPLFSVYSASKAGVCKYIEAINTEIEKLGFENRVTNVVATSFKGTSFNGGETNVKELDSLSKYLIDSMKNRREICKVNEELIDSIVERYNNDAKNFSKDSYDYKINSGRLRK